MSTQASAAAGTIAAFFQEASSIVGAVIEQPSAIEPLAGAVAHARNQLTALRECHESLCADAAISSCGPLRNELDVRLAQAEQCVNHLNAAHRTAIEQIEADCRAMLACITVMRTAVTMVAGGVATKDDLYPAVAEAYRAAVAKGAKVRSMLSGADRHSSYENIAFQVGILLRRAGDFYFRFVQ